ncbi:hypothetical protein MKZ38_003103 [Zalerion maritima]|uniref:AA1-like domain-containing protein n=1 Tax=Zalerion maritima TaxID=339359 RepID=A0AAD5RYF8_9PEZI|nr:hypothetical protein MKZ38_003103 [Zalerion maritima]
MLFLTNLLLLALAAVSTPVFALPRNIPHFSVPQEHLEVLRMRRNTDVNPNAVYDVTCINPKTNIVFHDSTVAQLAICGGISGSISSCQGSPASTYGQSRSAKFVLTPTVEGATVEISKDRWEQCVRAARAVCPTGSMSGTCVGGASSGDLSFTLMRSK